MTNAQAAQPAQPAHGFGDNKGIQFKISTKGAKWLCTLQDRSAYERKKAEGQPAESTEAAAESTGSSTSTSSSAASTKST